MASTNFLTALAGLTGGFASGLEKSKKTKQEQQNINAERTLRLRKFEAEMKRNAMLDKLDEQVSKSRVMLDKRAIELEEEKQAQRVANETEIPYWAPGADEPVMLLSQDIRDLNKQRILFKEQQDTMVESPAGGYISPETAFKEGLRSSEADKEAVATIKAQIDSKQDTLIRAGLPPEEARRMAFEFAKKLYPSELEDLILQEEDPSAEVVEEEGVNRLASLIAPLINYYKSLPQAYGSLGRLFEHLPDSEIERVRDRIFGQKTPQTLEELQAAREGRLLEMRGLTNRGIASIPPISLPENLQNVDLGPGGF